MKLFDATMDVIEKVLDLRDLRHRVIAANIANEETPGYRAKDLRFLDALSAAVRSQPRVAVQVTHVRHLHMAEPSIPGEGRIVEVPATELPLDANSVNLDSEMVKLSDNAMHYNTAATVVALRFRQLLAAIREGR